MVISPSEKAVLLERLRVARETKAAKAAAKKKETPASVKEPEPPAPAPVVAPPPVPEPAPIVPPPPSEPIDIPVVPDLVASSKKKPAKKVVESDSDDSDSVVLPPKKGKGKPTEKPKYMKIVLYREPKNTTAFQQLMEAVQDEQPELEPEVSPPPSASIERGRKFDIKNKTPAQSRTLPTPQELMRRAALEFFS